MIQLPHDCNYYLNLCRENVSKKDYVSALRMLALAQTYADNSDDEYECFAEKLGIFDTLGADVLAVCYESIAKQAGGEEMYAVLVNNAVLHKDVEQAAYYLDLYNAEGGEEVPVIAPSDAKDEGGQAAADKLVREFHGADIPDIRAVDSEEEYVNGRLRDVMDGILAGKPEPDKMRDLLQLRSDNPKLDERICQVLSQCAEVLPFPAAMRIYRILEKRAGHYLSVVCDACVNRIVREDRELWQRYDEHLLYLTSKELPERHRRIAALALLEHDHPDRALEILSQGDVSLADIYGRRMYISALFRTEGREDEALSMIEDSLLLEENDDRIVWEFYREYGKKRCFEHYNCVYFSVKESVIRDAMGMDTEAIRKTVRTDYGRFMFESIARSASLSEVPLSEEQLVAFICLYTDYQPEAAIKLLYDHRISSRIKRTILHRFIYNNDVYDVKKYVFLTGVDRYITVEDFGYIYRNDVIFGEEFDNWPDRIRAAMCTAAVDCCFYDNYGEGELFEAVKKVYDKVQKMRAKPTYATIYRAVVLTLNPCLEDFYNITGMTEKDKSKVLSVAKKFGITVE